MSVAEPLQLPSWRHLEFASQELSVNLANSELARGETERKLRDIASELRAKLSYGLGLDVVAYGSLARLEASDASDFDYLLLAHKLDAPEHVQNFRAIANTAGRNAAGLKPPGATGMFGKVVSAGSLTHEIGLEVDTNTSHTRRMLTLEESVSLLLQDKHLALVKSIVSRYLLDYREHPKVGCPRFLLNDIHRYWYQLTVDYQAKRWTETPEHIAEPGGTKWGLRYLKLVITRKIAYAGTVASLFLSVLEARKQEDQRISASALIERFQLTPLDRLAEILRFAGSDAATRQAIGRVLAIADWFTGKLASESFRTIVNGVTEPRDPTNPPEFMEAATKARELHVQLVALFLDCELLRDQGRAHLLF